MTTSNFGAFADAVRARFAEMQDEDLFVVAADRDEIWKRYLGAFPPGTDPVFRERTEHDCSCCRHFIRSVGDVVAIQNGVLASVWDLSDLPEPYQTVANAMSEYVRGLEIRDVFLALESHCGVAENHERTASGEVLTWTHFSLDVPPRFVTRDCVARRGEARTNYQVLMRAVAELTPEALDTAVGLIDDDAIYRGAERRRAVVAFRKLQDRLLAVPEADRCVLAWTMVWDPVVKFRNTVIGTLVQDLSDGVDLERAVRSYETKVAPQNYKRPTALITKKMVEEAMMTIRELDLEPALERSHARLEDVSVDSVLFVDNHVRGRLRGGVEELLMKEVRPKPFDADRAEEISIEDFVGSVLPHATALHLWLDNGKLSNFASLTAPVHDDAPPLFRWGNGFAWSYEGNAADSIKERVKRAGGRVEGVALRASLAWYNTDDLDIHVREPGGNHIYFGNKGGKLDVDMNVMTVVRDPVENVRWVDRLRDGVYEVWVEQYYRRESVDVGFEVEVEHAGGLDTFRYDKAVRGGVQVAQITVRGGEVRRIKESNRVVAGASPREQWGLETQRLHRVDSVVLSPNYWDGAGVGNKHWFFILEGCQNPMPTRGIYNEFLKPELERHRRVFEVLGDRTKCPPVDEQMSGVGFSSTRRDEVGVVVTGESSTRSYRIKF